MELDASGCPVVDDEHLAATECPPRPCQFCTGDTQITDLGKKLSSWEWCQQFKTCAATVDWDRVFGHE
ncbi:MAG TPA: hypothetical protein VHV10_01400 [Ktedonobacteraceae bacterium]|nr:hypothetical protein [Ktedonobacteraceae bacterium]